MQLTMQGLLNGAENKSSIVFFLGGCTYTEIAALRFIAQHEGLSLSYCIIDTK
jgi:Sec1 family